MIGPKRIIVEYKGYRAEIEAREGTFAGRVLDLADVVTFEGATIEEAEQAFRDSLDDYIAFLAE